MAGKGDPAERLENLETAFGELVAKNNTITLQLDQIQHLLNNLGTQMPNPDPAKTQTKSPKTALSNPAPMAKS